MKTLKLCFMGFAMLKIEVNILMIEVLAVEGIFILLE